MAAASSASSASNPGNGVTAPDIEDEAMAQARTQARRVQATAEGAISDLQDKGRETVDAFREVADTFGDAVEDSLKRRPYATLAVVAGIGFLLGAVWKR
jgi:ElaB/YqjD/DUF883 family membrane-anchored ribosome-binding protein